MKTESHKKFKNFLGWMLVVLTPVLVYLILQTPISTQKQMQVEGVLSDRPILLVFFGFVGCKSICPTALQTVAGAVNELSEKQQSSVQLLFVNLTENPPMDIQVYASSFHKNFYAHQADTKKPNHILQQFGVRVENPSGSKEVMEHSAHLYFLLEDGEDWNMRRVYTQSPFQKQKILRELKSLLEEKHERSTISLKL